MSPSVPWPWIEPPFIEDLEDIADAAIELIEDTEGTSCIGQPIFPNDLVKEVGEGFLDLWHEFGEPVRHVACWTSRIIVLDCVAAVQDLSSVSHGTRSSHVGALVGLVGGHNSSASTPITRLVVDWMAREPWVDEPAWELQRWCDELRDGAFTALTVGCSFMAARAFATGLIS